MTVLLVEVDDNQPIAVTTRGDALNVIDSFIDHELKGTESEITVKIKSKQMTQEEFDNLPEFESY